MRYFAVAKYFVAVFPQDAALNFIAKYEKCDSNVDAVKFK